MELQEVTVSFAHSSTLHVLRNPPRNSNAQTSVLCVHILAFLCFRTFCGNLVHTIHTIFGLRKLSTFCGKLVHNFLDFCLQPLIHSPIPPYFILCFRYVNTLDRLFTLSHPVDIVPILCKHPSFFLLFFPQLFKSYH